MVLGRQKRAAAQPAIDAITSECEELRGTVDTLNKKQAVLMHENNELKAANASARDKLVRGAVFGGHMF